MAEGLIALIEKYEEIRARKDELAEETKKNNQEFKEIQERIVEQMVEDDIPMMGYGNYNYYPQTVTHYSFLSEDKLAENGVTDKFDAIRSAGLDFLIKETINQRSMESAFKEIVENEGELPEDLQILVSEYEEIKINRRKASGSALKKAQKAINS